MSTTNQNNSTNPTIKEASVNLYLNRIINGSTYYENRVTIGRVIEGEPGYIHYATNRMYTQMELPSLPANVTVKKAVITLYQAESEITGTNIGRIGMYEMTSLPDAENNVEYNQKLIDYKIIKTATDGNTVKYTFDVTAIAEQMLKEERTSILLLFKLINEEITSQNSSALNTTVYSQSSSTNKPELCVTYETNFGVNALHETETSDVGIIHADTDLICGNLLLNFEDFAWGGNKMPVTLNHYYNSSLAEMQYTANAAAGLQIADFSAMKLGLGWRHNFMQSMTPDGTDKYVYTDENGNGIIFNAKIVNDVASTVLFESSEDSDTLYNATARTITMGEEIYTFDTLGRLISIADKYNSMTVAYENNRIASVTDGAKRVFSFSYNADGFLSEITAPDGNKVTYTYEGNLLASVTSPDGKKAFITYLDSKPQTITAANSDGTPLFKTEYVFSDNKVAFFTEYGAQDGNFVEGETLSFEYSAPANTTKVNRTTPAETADDTADTVTTVYTFNDDGEVLSRYAYSVEDSVPSNASGIIPKSDGGDSVILNVNNLLLNHNFEKDSDWERIDPHTNSNFTFGTVYSQYAKYGDHEMKLSSTNNQSTQNGIYQQINNLNAGEYTFSVYMRALGLEDADLSAFIRVRDTDNNVLAVSETLTKADTEHTRLVAPFTLDSEKSVKAEICLNGKGSVYVDAAQLENNPFANDYNILENGCFENDTTDWVGGTYSADTYFSGTRCIKLASEVYASPSVSQTVKCKTEKNVRETFTLSGWAKADSLPSNPDSEEDMKPTFRLRAEVCYHDISGDNFQNENFYADFSPATTDWQFASVEFSKSHYGLVEYIRIYCDYNFNFGDAYFDNLKLVRNSIEEDLDSSDFTGSEGVETAEEETNVTESENAVTEDSAPEFEEFVDQHGNTITETTFQDGEFGTIYRSFGYTPAIDGSGNIITTYGNDLIRETDSRGNVTDYEVDELTSRNEVVTDRLGNKTAYEYDASGRTTKVTSKTANNTEIANVSYSYDAFDNLTEILRGDGMKYSLCYNAFHELQSIGIDGMVDTNNNPLHLVNYTYKNAGGNLKEIAYANGDKMSATYNGQGQLIAEKWYNKDNNLTAHYKYVYDNNGNIVRSIDILSQKEYNYLYEQERIVRACEYTITLSGEIITAKTLVNAIKYYYNSEGDLTKKVISPAGKDELVIYFEKDANEAECVKFELGGKVITSHSKTDGFGRKEFDEVQFGTGFASRKFEYLNGVATNEHIDNGKLKSTPTTQLVSRITLSSGRTIEYEYDAEERITKVTDSVDGITEYYYDALGQLTGENHKPVGFEYFSMKNYMSYDNYGNILSKNGVTYTYGDSVWKDKLTGVGSQTITYDNQGNPLNYLGKVMTWEKGRQLKSIDNNTYSYNANGIRTSKYVSSEDAHHTYILDGTKILREDWTAYGGAISYYIIPIYDNEDNVCGINFCGANYFFLKNLQGDVIEILSAHNGETVARYSYDAWGKCTIDSSSLDTVIAYRNPFRYRSYYYDQETDLYYLQSRYYDANVGRFVNSDMPEIATIPEQVLQTNLYTYCRNNPVFFIDNTGYVVTPANIIGAAIGIVIGIVGGIFLGNWLAGILKLKGWKRVVFVAAISALVGAAAGAIGYFIGPYVAKAFKVLSKGLKGLFKGLTKPKIGTKLGKIGTLTRNTKPVIKGFTKHGLDRMAERGVSKALAQKVVKTGYAVKQSRGNVLYFTKEAVVVLNRAGEIVTTYSSAHFDENMQAIVNLFYK